MANFLAGGIGHVGITLSSWRWKVIIKINMRMCTCIMDLLVMSSFSVAVLFEDTDPPPLRCADVPQPGPGHLVPSPPSPPGLDFYLFLCPSFVPNLLWRAFKSNSTSGFTSFASANKYHTRGSFLERFYSFPATAFTWKSICI